MVFSPLFQVIKKNAIYILFLFSASIGLYFNSLSNEFAVVDDLNGYIENTQIRNISASLLTFHIQNIIYAINYHFFGINPLFLRIFALLDHAVASILIFIIIQYLFNKKTAYLASLLFAVHPVNSEAINWISAQFYILMANFQFAAILSHIAYRKTNNNRYLYLTIAIITLYLILFQHPWVLTAPLVICIIDICILRKNFNGSFQKKFWLLLAPILLIYFIIRFPQTYTDRMNGQSDRNGKILMNEQAIIPIIESYPYSIYNMFRLYTFPKNLTIYYDGRSISTSERILMFASFIFYIVFLIYSYNKNKKIAGLLLLLPICIAPVFSPIKVTWYITERYLYFGAGFYTTLLALSFILIERKIHIKQLSYVLVGIFVCIFAIRTFYRTLDWKNPETLALATIQTSPKSVRPYNDVAGYYVLHNRIAEAKVYYQKALAMYPSIVAMNNLGYIYLLHDLDPSVRTLHQSPQDILLISHQALENKEYRLALYYLNEIYTPNTQNIQILNAISTSMIELGSIDKAEKYIDKALSINPQDTDALFLYGYLAFKKGDVQAAIFTLEKVLQLNPNHVGAKANLEYLTAPTPSLPTPIQK